MRSGLRLAIAAALAIVAAPSGFDRLPVSFGNAASAQTTLAQTTAPSAPAPAAPPSVTLTQPGAPPTPSPPAPGLSTLVPQPGDPGDVDEVVLPARPVAILSGQSSWDDGLKTMRATLQRMRDELDRAGIKVTGRPLTVFTETTDDTFKFDAMLPIESASGIAAPAGLRFGTTPSGKAYRFVHKAPYDEIDATYETITAYLDAKDIVAKDAFIEEYLSDTADPADTSMTINIFVQPK